MEERMKFLARLKQGERMSDLCNEFGISRKTGYKFVERFERLSVVGLVDQKRTPIRSPQQTSSETEELIIELKREHPTWGPRKILAVLEAKHTGIRFPVHSTVSRIFEKRGFVTRRPRRHRPEIAHSPLLHAEKPHDVLCIDYKGQFGLRDGMLCYPLTLTDACSRYILACEGFNRIDGGDVKLVLEDVFREHGVPAAMRFDGGAPFASNALWGWSQLSVWLLRLGVRLEQIEPASPQQNGRHERMHRTLKQETTRPPAANLLQQQERFDRFVEVFNQQRPHEALGQKPPASVYQRSTRAFPTSLPEPEYPMHDLTVVVGNAGHIRLPGFGRRLPNFFVSAALRGQPVGLRELTDKTWLVSFLQHDIGELDLEKRRFSSYRPPVSKPAPKPSVEAGAETV
jgi:putative transposase